jgi:hypothetical protein
VSRKAFLHIGLPKTGTTYLQQILWENKEELAEQGVLLPGRNRRRHLLASLDVREDPKLARREGDVEAPWQDLVTEAQEWPGDVLISHEFFAAASRKQIRRMKRSLVGFQLHAVVTARPMTDLGVSRWQEWVKSGGTLSVDEYPSRQLYRPMDEWGWGSFDLAGILGRWGKVLRHERIHVLPVDPGAAPEALWLRFADLLGVDPTGFRIPPKPANTSLGVVEVELLRRVNLHLREDFATAADQGNWIRGFLAEGKVLPRRPERFRAGDEKQRELVERGLRAVALLQSGGYDVRGDLTKLEPSLSSDLRHPQQVSDAEMLESATVAMANMLRTVRALTEERDALRAQQPTSGGRDPRRGVRWLWRRVASVRHNQS